MKTKSLKLIAFLLILTGSFSSCKDDILLEPPVDNPTEPKLQIYSLYGTMCNWTNRENDGRVVVINSDEELKQYVSCYMDKDYHPFDFSKQSMLLVGSVASSGIYDIFGTSIHQLSLNEYELKVKIRRNEITVPLEWDIAVRVDKLNDDAQVVLRVEELPASITSVIGKWKLMKEQTSGFMSPSKEIDYSKRNIVYEFKTNGVLTVSGNGNTGWKGKGEHSYSIGNYKEIRAGYTSSMYSVSPSELIIDNRHVDGPAFYFAKIKN
jgi:hypothetical protein